MKEAIVTSIRLPANLYIQLEILSKEMGVAKSTIIKIALKQYISQMKTK
ncbi:MAG: ribbon-helix-helix protein, CopG family [Selenomonadaceae bacterium]|nr:ribbon-helix-helix protein, CopG family [Selenomonadaceae bacterium]